MAHPANRRTTKAQFALFKRTCLGCIRRWGISSWQIEICHEDLGDKLAQCGTQVHDRLAWLSFSTSVPKEQESELTRDNIIRLARHETTHLLIAPLADVLIIRELTASHKREANEAVCNHLEKLLP